MVSSTRDRPGDLVVAGHVNIDRFLRVAAFPAPDRTVPVLLRREELGGTATNIARTALRYGVSAGLVARVGSDFPATLRTHLVETRLDLRGVETVATPSSPTCTIVEDRQGAQRTLIEQGAMEGARPYRLPRGWLERYSWLHLTTGPPRAQLELARRARRLGLKVAADPAQEVHYRWGERDLRSLLGQSEILMGNRHEIDRAASLLHRSGPRGLLDLVPLVVRTEGKEGASAFYRGGTEHAPGRAPRRVRSIVGAGDAFRGGFYAGWFAGEPLAGSLGAGVRAASRWIEGGR